MTGIDPFDENTVYNIGDLVTSEVHTPPDGDVWECRIDNIQGTWEEVQDLDYAKGVKGGFAVSSTRSRD